MTNPIHKKTHEQVEMEIKQKHPTIVLLDDYIDTNTKIRYKCNHGINFARPWELKKRPHCCRKGYYESGKMWASHRLSIDTIKQRILNLNPNIDVSELIHETPKVKNLRCIIHNVKYDAHLNGDYRIGLCPQCGKLKQQASGRTNIRLAQAAFNSTYISKAETKWLDELGIKERQVWLSDIKYKVDGYDSVTKTVYLYHGRFWHGCPDTYDPEMWHPVLKKTMKEIYASTLARELQIKQAGYNLIVQWGT